MKRSRKLGDADERRRSHGRKRLDPRYRRGHERQAPGLPGRHLRRRRRRPASSCSASASSPSRAPSTPSSTLSTSSAYASATSTLGGGIEPSLIVEFPTLLGFLEGVGLAQSESLAKILPYLKSLGTLTAGATSQGGVQHFRVVLGLA